MKLAWQPGRLGTGYEKLLLLSSVLPLPFDIHLLKLPKGSVVKPHTDSAPNGKKHYRCNIFLKKASKGGKSMIEGRSLWVSSWLELFRPDIQTHAVSEIEEGESLVLSIGWLLDD